VVLQEFVDEAIPLELRSALIAFASELPFALIVDAIEEHTFA
jgi:hypothetical protein